MNKPTKPNITIPKSFATNGVKADFDNNKILKGFDRIQPDVWAGDNLNKFIDDTYKGLNYALDIGDYIEEEGIANTDLSNLSEEGEAKFDEKVNKSGDTMSGQLVVEQNGNTTIATKTLDIAYTDTPATPAGFGQFAVCDKNGDWIALYGAEMYDDGRNLAKMQVRAKDGTHARIQIWAENDNQFYCEFPKCTTKPTTTSSASLFKVAVVTQNYLNGSSWYRVWSDGFIEQGGAISNQTTPISITFAKTFTNANSVRVLFETVSTGNAMPICLNGKPTVSGFSIFRYGGGHNIAYTNWYACGY